MNKNMQFRKEKRKKQKKGEKIMEKVMKQVLIMTMGIVLVGIAGCFAGNSLGARYETDGKVDQKTSATSLARYERPGFVVKIEDGRLWVFKQGSKELADFEANGELSKHVIRPGAGPGRITIKAPDAETVDAYLQAVK